MSSPVPDAAKSAAEWSRVIAHVDMDAFYASVESRDDPALRGKPLAVGGSPDGRGVVASASYEARRFGVRSAMPARTALRLCPDLLLIPGNMEKYGAASRALRRVLREFSPVMEPLSLDEAFLDLTGTQRLLGSPEDVGRAVRARIREELSLTASVGVAASKFVAKLASDYRKPDGLTVVGPDGARAFVRSLPLDRLWGAGPATLAALARHGIRTTAELARADPDRLRGALGAGTERLIRLACGLDDRPVVPDHARKSISHETTFARDEADEGVLAGVLLGLSENVARRARRALVHGRTVHLKVRLSDFSTLVRSRTPALPTREAVEIFRTARALLAGVDRKGKPIRLLGVGLSGLGTPPQLDLFDDAHDAPRIQKLQEAEDAVVERFGRRAVVRARTLLAAGTRDTSLPAKVGTPQSPT